MICSSCSKEMKKGVVRLEDARMLSYSSLVWYPGDEEGKKVRKDYVDLKSKAEGYYCEECMKVLAIFDER